MSNDYILRQIEDMARFLGSVLFMKRQAEPAIIDERGDFNNGQFLLYQLEKMALEGKINEAENLLFSTVENNPRPEYLEAALDFYEFLCQMGEVQLQAGNFSNQEILDGLRDIQQFFPTVEPSV